MSEHLGDIRETEPIDSCANPGAIGYISGGVTADGVKLLSIR